MRYAATLLAAAVLMGSLRWGMGRRYPREVRVVTAYCEQSRYGQTRWYTLVEDARNGRREVQRGWLGADNETIRIAR